jgi:hypothetical protein
MWETHGAWSVSFGILTTATLNFGSTVFFEIPRLNKERIKLWNFGESSALTNPQFKFGYRKGLSFVLYRAGGLLSLFASVFGYFYSQIPSAFVLVFVACAPGWEVASDWGRFFLSELNKIAKNPFENLKQMFRTKQIQLSPVFAVFGLFLSSLSFLLPLNFNLLLGMSLIFSAMLLRSFVSVEISNSYHQNNLRPLAIDFSVWITTVWLAFFVMNFDVKATMTLKSVSEGLQSGNYVIAGVSVLLLSQGLNAIMISVFCSRKTEIQSQELASGKNKNQSFEKTWFQMQLQGLVEFPEMKYLSITHNSKHEANLKSFNSAWVGLNMTSLESYTEKKGIWVDFIGGADALKKKRNSKKFVIWPFVVDANLHGFFWILKPEWTKESLRAKQKLDSAFYAASNSRQI